MANLTEKSKHLAFLLRHDTSYEFIGHGWREISELTGAHGFSVEELEEIVATDRKGRYEFNDDRTMVRARQGHSVNVDIELEKATPPDVLFHGTATWFLDSIRDVGILKMGRNHVHLTTDKSKATETGRRHGEPVVLAIDAKAMSDAGIEFYLSRNDVWLTDHVNAKFIKNITKDK